MRFFVAALLLLSLSQLASCAIVFAGFSDATCTALTAAPLQVNVGQCTALGTFPGALGKYGMVTSVSGTSISYSVGCSSATCSNCFLSGVAGVSPLTLQPLCVVTSLTSNAGSTSVQFFSVTSQQKYTASAFALSQCSFVPNSNFILSQTICNDINSGYYPISGNTCTFLTSTLGYALFQPSDVNASLAFGMFGCDSYCLNCQSYSKCGVTDKTQYACPSAWGSMMIKPPYSFPDLSDK